MPYRLEIREDDCMSAGKCVADFPDAFEFNQDELASLLPGETNLSDSEKIRVSRNCPGRAILVFDADDQPITT